MSFFGGPAFSAPGYASTSVFYAPPPAPAVAPSYASTGVFGAPLPVTPVAPAPVAVTPSAAPFSPANPVPPTAPTSTSSPPVGRLTMSEAPAVGKLGGAEPSSGIGAAMTFAPGSIGYSTIEASPIPTFVSDALKNPLYIAGAVMVALLVLRR